MTRATLLAAATMCGCGGSATAPLIDIPDLEVTSPSVARGALVGLRVTNTTESEVILPAPVCTTTLEVLTQGQWFAVDPGEPDCVGVAVTLGPGASHQFGVPTPADRAGQYRAVVTGSNADGQFVIRSPTFTVE